MLSKSKTMRQFPASGDLLMRGIVDAIACNSRWGGGLHLHLVPAEVFVVEALEPAAEFFGRGAFRRPVHVQFG